MINVWSYTHVKSKLLKKNKVLTGYFKGLFVSQVPCHRIEMLDPTRTSNLVHPIFLMKAHMLKKKPNIFEMSPQCQVKRFAALAASI